MAEPTYLQAPMNKLRYFHVASVEIMRTANQREFTAKSRTDNDLPRKLERLAIRMYKNEKETDGRGRLLVEKALDLLGHLPHPLTQTYLFKLHHPEANIKIEYSDRKPAQLLSEDELNFWGFTESKETPNIQHVIDIKLLIPAICTALRIGEIRKKIKGKRSTTRGIAKKFNVRNVEQYLREARTGQELIKRTFRVINESRGLSGDHTVVQGIKGYRRPFLLPRVD